MKKKQKPHVNVHNTTSPSLFYRRKATAAKNEPSPRARFVATLLMAPEPVGDEGVVEGLETAPVALVPFS